MSASLFVLHEKEMKVLDRKTPLYDRHLTLGGKIVSFADYLLPVQYSGVIKEHEAVREKAGLFDVSHMGEIQICGTGALSFLNKIFTNDFADMEDGMVRYTLLLCDSGGIVDDLLVYRFSETSYLLVPNAGNRAKVFRLMNEYRTGDTQIYDQSEVYAQIALQGPRSRDILLRLTGGENIPSKYYTFTHGKEVAGADCIISQTGYTGEFGFELYCFIGNAPGLWDALLEAGEDFGLIPCGLGARDTLRLEAGMPLYGHELSEETTPFETGLAFAVKMQKDDFIGKKSLLARGAPQIIRTGLKVTGNGIVRDHCPVWKGTKKIGTTTSGNYLPYCKYAGAMAHLNADDAAIGTIVDAEVRDKMLTAEIVPLPFYRRFEKRKGN